MRFSYISRPELLDMPGYEAREEDDRVLTQLLLDIMMVDDSKGMMGRENLDDRGSLPDMQDELARCARELWKSGTVSVHTVFASRVALDILSICGKSDQPAFHRDVIEAARFAHSTIGFEVEANGVLSTGDTRWPQKDSHQLLPLYQLIDMHILKPTYPMLKDMLMNMHEKDPGQHFSGNIDDMPPEIQAAVRQSMIAKGIDPSRK
ncbi:uncharacterized protein CLAFUR5_10198 [Fulvia fulva]|uniref:Uncharacterized protein n=1 Tax=Passalora fulva TaxID=5499 RepID=A0A9Q8PDB0_PASFU|nr:uncharacterized protein CLAFUR5_10198 [Fulvia fulva]UJO20436.1 hypothetical protein CLAFUR5_10198 [Fulvia fulva]